MKLGCLWAGEQAPREMPADGSGTAVPSISVLLQPLLAALWALSCPAAHAVAVFPYAVIPICHSVDPFCPLVDW